jgi:predicted phage terminase large subunit-like protein
VQALEETRRQLGSYVFAAQFQQNPTPADGNLIKKEWLKRYDQALRLPKFQNVILACDPAGKPGQHNDYTAIVVAGITTNDVIVLHVARGHWTQMQMGLRIEELKNQHVVDLALIEDTATGVGLIQDLRRRSNISVLGVTPKADKESRLYAQLGQFEAGQVLLPMEAPWLADFERELLSFPATRNDDQVDALILILERFRNRPPPIPMTGPIFFTIPRTTMRDWR